MFETLFQLLFPNQTKQTKKWAEKLKTWFSDSSTPSFGLCQVSVSILFNCSCMYLSKKWTRRFSTKFWMQHQIRFSIVRWKLTKFIRFKCMHNFLQSPRFFSISGQTLRWLSTALMTTSNELSQIGCHSSYQIMPLTLILSTWTFYLLTR